jgi:sortase (surface protein transpeptidase)
LHQELTNYIKKVCSDLSNQIEPQESDKSQENDYQTHISAVEIPVLDADQLPPKELDKVKEDIPPLPNIVSLQLCIFYKL